MNTDPPLSDDTAPPAEAPPVRVTAAPAPPERPAINLKPLRLLMGFYLFLWVMEGAVRKWFLPGLASPLLVIRDPFLLLMYAMALQKGVFPRSAFIYWITGLGLFAFLMSVVGTKAPLLVELFGLRADYLHLPLIFLMPMVFDRDDIRRVGKWTLITALPMSALVFLQFVSSPNARINAGVGGELGGMLESAFGHIRPSGTFSFTNGLADYTALVAAFLLYHVMEKNIYPRLLAWAATPALLVLIGLSGSRGAVGIVIVILTTVLFVSVVQIRYVQSTLKLFGLGALMIAGLGTLTIFKQGMSVFAYRFGNAANVRTGFIDRFFLGFLMPFELAGGVPFYGVGLGMGTSVGAGLILGDRGFLYAESEMGRVMIEGGPIVGSAFLLLRLAITVFLLINAVGSLRRRAYTLPMLLLGACATEMFTGQFGQATTLGYVTIACGLCLASNRPGVNDAAGFDLTKPIPPPPVPRVRRAALAAQDAPPVTEAAMPPAATATPAAVPAAPAFQRGRSLYAEQMHRQMAEEAKRNVENQSPAPGSESAD